MSETLSQLELDELWDFDDPAKSEAQLRAAQTAASDPGVAAELATQVARALGLQDRFTEADALLDSITEESPAVVVRVLLERGRLRTSSDHLAEAIPLFQKSLAAAAAAKLAFLEIDSAHMLVIAEPTRAQHWTARGLRTVGETDDRRTKRWAFGLHNNLGWRFFDDGKPAAALAEFELAADAAAEYGTPQQQEHAQHAIDQARGEIGDELRER